MMAKITGRTFFILISLLGAGVLVFFMLPTLLIAPSETPKADVIVDLSINPHSKADSYVAWLYREGVARNVVTISSQISHDTYPGDYVRDHLVTLGVKQEDARTFHIPIPDCQAQLLTETAKYLKSNGWRSALLICGPEDSRSLARLSRRILGKEGIEVAVGYAPEDLTEITTEWWQTHWKVQRLVNGAMNISLDLFYSECR